KHLLDLYESGDLYTEVSQSIFSSKQQRKLAKQLFLSFAYGMSLKKLADAAAERGATRKTASDFFRQFSDFERWKESIAEEYRATGRIGTSLGNYARRSKDGDLTP